MSVAGNTNTATSVTFLQQLREQYPEPLIVIWDMVRPSRAIREYLTTRIELAAGRTPGYSPDFNPDEAIWDWIREDVTANTCLARPQVREKVDAFFAGLTERAAKSNSAGTCKHKRE